MVGGGGFLGRDFVGFEDFEGSRFWSFFMEGSMLGAVMKPRGGVRGGVRGRGEGWRKGGRGERGYLRLGRSLSF